jgi:hypothetical protein
MGRSENRAALFFCDLATRKDRTMKRISLLLATALAFALAGCGQDAGKKDAGKTTPPPAEEKPEPKK